MKNAHLRKWSISKWGIIVQNSLFSHKELRNANFLTYSIFLLENWLFLIKTWKIIEKWVPGTRCPLFFSPALMSVLRSPNNHNSTAEIERCKKMPWANVVTQDWTRMNIWFDDHLTRTIEGRHSYDAAQYTPAVYVVRSSKARTSATSRIVT